MRDEQSAAISIITRIASVFYGLDFAIVQKRIREQTDEPLYLLCTANA